MPVSVQHVIGTISLLLLTISVGLSFTYVSSSVQADINRKQMAQLAGYVSLNLVEIAALTNSSNLPPITMIKTIELPVDLGGKAYTVELVNATNQGRGYLVRVSLVSQPSVNAASFLPLNGTGGQMIIAANPVAGWGPTVPSSKPVVTYADKLYGGSEAVVWAHQQDTRESISLNSPSSSSGSWSNSMYAYADDTNAAEDGQGKTEVYGTYGFSFTGTVKQVRIRFDAWRSADDGIKVEFSTDGGSTWNANAYDSTQNRPALTGAETTYWWDITTFAPWNSTLLNDANFKVRVTQVRIPPPDTTYLDWIPVEVTTTDSAILYLGIGTLT